MGQLLRSIRLRWFAAAILLTATSAQAQRPNLVVFLVDDMGWQETSVPFHSERTPLNERYRTPNMERLAASGVKFTQAYAYALCSPSRVSLMTGQSASRHRVTNWTLRKDVQPDHAHPKVRAADWNWNGFSPEPGVPRTVHAQTLPQLLREAGYRTIHAGKAHFGAKGTPGEEPLNCGFDVNIGGHAAGGPGSYHGQHDYSAAWRNADRIWDVPHLEAYHGTETNLTEALTIEALRAVKETIDAESPFYLYLSHYAIHAPWEKDHRFFDSYAEAGLSEFEATYASMVESMDKSLGDVLDLLEDEGIEDETIVLFLSDNGQPSQAPRNLPLRGHKLTPYEGGLRVPMLARWPGITPAGAVCERVVHVDDLFPTVLELAGIPLERATGPLDGMSFVPLLRDPAAPAPATPRSVFWHYPNTYDQPPYTAMRHGRWKLIYHHVDRRLELFDLVQDLGETADLATGRPDLVRSMAAQMTAHLRETEAVMTIDKRTEAPVELPLVWLDREASREPPLAEEWEWVGPVVAEEGYHVWGGSPVIGPEGRVHLFVARWPIEARFDPGWRTHSEIAQYVGDEPKGPFRFVDVVARGDGDGWDASGHHNPAVRRVGDRYALAYISNTGIEGHPANQRIGLMVADHPDGPWTKLGRDGLVLEPDPAGWNAGSRCGVNNPALIQAADGRFLLYFKTIDTRPGKQSHPVMGVAIAEDLEGPYTIQPEPITRNERTIEDGTAFHWRGRLHLLTTDNHGILEKGGGLLWSSPDGQRFDGEPVSGFHLVARYYPGSVPADAKHHYGQRTPKFERPQVLVQDGEPRYLFAPSGTNLEGGLGTSLYLLERRAVRRDLRAMSFNVRYGSARDGENHWERRKENVVATIHAFDPDLLGLQEALPFQSRRIAEALPGHELYGPGRDGPGTDGEACAVLWRRERFEALERGTFWLSPTPDVVASRGWDAALPRICSWVRLRDRHTDKAFVYANTHFDHRGAEARLESARLLAGRFPDETVLLTGDFNAGESSEPIAALRAGGFVDAYRVVEPEADGVGTFTGFRDAPGSDKIDYVFLRGAADVFAATIDRSRFEGRWPSDHFPVTATIRWR